MLTIGLLLIFIIVLVAPFLNKKIESNLEAFLFLMGVISATMANAWSAEVLHEGFIAPIIIILGLVSSLISAIIAALLLVEFISVLPLHRHAEVNLTVIACFAIGFGAALTPLGEPLSTIVVSKLSGPPYHATFYYLFNLLALYVIPVVVVLGIVAIFLVHEAPEDTSESLAAEEEEEALSEVFVRSGKVYIFVMALIFLG